ncbi:MAG: hypothetical protein QG641_191 [Candidatus Poribacteria bacterium]|nr:hypothetical protein [Candidatus Poribacteria bacterium]
MSEFHPLQHQIGIVEKVHWLMCTSVCHRMAGMDQCNHYKTLIKLLKEFSLTYKREYVNI